MVERTRIVSTDEQDLIFGRLKRQRRESMRVLAAISAKLDQVGKDLRESGDTFKGFLLPEAPANITKARQAVSRIPKPEEVLSTLQELEAERERLNQIDANLKPFDEL